MGERAISDCNGTVIATFWIADLSIITHPHRSLFLLRCITLPPIRSTSCRLRQYTMHTPRACRQEPHYSSTSFKFTTETPQSATYTQLRCEQHQAAVAAQAAASPPSDHSLMSSALFTTLPQLLARLCPCPAPLRSLDLRLFNEHYVVKPPESYAEFSWHRDDVEQLDMLQDESLFSRDYFSFWCPLDDVRVDNGTLRLLPKSTDTCLRFASDAWIENVAEPLGYDIVCSAGDVVCFTSSLWHRSWPNSSSSWRRVWYVQYSCGPLLSRQVSCNIATCSSQVCSISLSCRAMEIRCILQYQHERTIAEPLCTYSFSIT
jgi:hypothetical protein